MALRPPSRPPVPEATAAVVQAAFPKGNLYVALRAECGSLDEDQLCAELSPPQGRPVDVAPWRLALVLVMQSLEGLTNRQAADAVRRCIDWTYALSLELTDPGFDFTLLHDVRDRVLTHEAAQRLLDTVLIACKARGWINARGTNGRMPPTSWPRSARSTASHACWKPCVTPAISSVRRRPPGSSGMCPGSGLPAMACGPNKRACRRRRAHARPWLGRSGRTALSSSTGWRLPRARQACVLSPRLKPCVGLGSNTMIVVRSPGGKCSAGAPETSTRPRRG
jgi:transposase